VKLKEAFHGCPMLPSGSNVTRRRRREEEEEFLLGYKAM
jgi:hypothetical protein